jgi:Uma2 family endonuclease
MIETPERIEPITNNLTGLTTESEQRVVRYADRPITFEAYLDIPDGGRLFELVHGVLMEKSMVQLEHEKLFSWIYRLLGDYVESRELGIVLGSRSAVRINDFGARLPEVFFVHRDRLGAVEDSSTVAAPDLVIELVSPSDRPSHLIALESDYRSLGVTEILFVDQRKQRVRRLLRNDDDYAEFDLTDGEWRSEVVDGFAVKVAWLLHEPRPEVRRTLDVLLAAART